jgi:HEPN domain-containing protein
LQRILEIQAKLKQAHASNDRPVKDVPPEIQSLSLVTYAQDYLRAADRVANPELTTALPLLQLTGQSVELALKACLAAAGQEPPRKHDLVSLYILAESLGFSLKDEMHLAALAHLNHWFSADLITETRFKSRYPPPGTEGIGGSIPPHAVYREIISSLCEQVRLKHPRLWPPGHSFIGQLGAPTA